MKKIRMSKSETRSGFGISACALIGCALSLLPAAGCNVVGAVAAKTLPDVEKPKYLGLQNQSIAVMVWADRAVRIDWDRIELDLANAVQTYMQSSKARELKGATYPVQPASIVRFQLDHPELEAVPVTEFAAQFGVSRLIYVELEQFSTRSSFSYQMYRGSATATLRVVEIAEGRAKVAYEQNGITAVFPEKGPADGEIVGSDAAFYAETIKALAVQLVRPLITYELR